MDLAKLALDDEWLAQLEAVAGASRLDLPPKRLAAEVRALSDAYNAGEFWRSRTRGALAARLLFSFPRDVPKMACAARELAFAGRLSGALRVLDVGAGLGASTWGLARLLAARGERASLDATFVDDDPAALEIARAIARARARDGQVDVRIATDAPSGKYDVVLVGQALGEMTADEGAQTERLVDLLATRLADDGSLVVVEPALADRTRRLHRVRDALLARGVTVFAPCLHAAPCPMLADEGHGAGKSWCHEDLPIDLPAPIAAVARAAGLRWQGLTFSYLVLRNDGATLQGALGSPRGAARVVSLPIVTKGKRELYLCGEGRVRKIARLDRDEERRGAFTRAHRGDVIAFSPPLAVDAKRAGPDVSPSLVLVSSGRVPPA